MYKYRFSVVLLMLLATLVTAGKTSVADRGRKPPTTTTTTTTTTAPPTTGGPSSWWVPGTAPIEWQWELDHPLSLTSSTDMATDEETYLGAPAPVPAVYDIDGIENPAATVSALHSLGTRVVCYIEVGTAGNYYSAAEEGLSSTYYAQLQAAGDLGDKLAGYPEHFLNIDTASTLSIIEAMINQQCAAKGFDGVETDLDETFNNNEGATGFSISEAQEESYMTAVANDIHAHGMAWFIKDPDDIGNASYADAMYPLADAVLTEQCNQYDACQYLSEYEGSKAIFDAEYTPTAAASFCPSDNAADINGVLFDADLDGLTRVPCR
ncbi:MAG: endo alpha-1,4 polygalactosaminidase [Acidimicrobiales bacterium]